jgi:hypothetical protein
VARIAMSDSSQFLQLPRTPPISLGCSAIERPLPRVRQFDLWSSAPSCVMDRPQRLIGDERFCRLFRAVRDTSAALAHARLFICSPHSREVVKNRFFTLFWSREPQKWTARWQPAGSCEAEGRKQQARQPMQDLSGRLSVGEASKVPGSSGECGARSGDVLIIGGRL